MGESLLRWFVYLSTAVLVVWALAVLGLVGRVVVGAITSRLERR